MENTIMYATTLSAPVTAPATASVSKAKVRTAWAMTIIVTLFLAFDGVLHLTMIDAVVNGWIELGFSPRVSVPLAIIELVFLALYLIPRTSVLGALVLTGYLGGAIAAHVRIDNPLFSHALFPVYVAALLWGGLLLRDERLRSFILPRR
jgi:hypothetical protein